MALELNDLNFSETISNEEKIVMVDFFAEWCAPCRMMGPIVDELSKEVGDKALVAKVDVDENPELVTMFEIKSLPTMIFLKNGKVIDKTTGAMNKTKLIEKIDSL